MPVRIRIEYRDGTTMNYEMAYRDANDVSWLFAPNVARIIIL